LTSYDQTFHATAPAEAGVHAGRVRGFLAELRRRALPLHSLLLYRSGRVVPSTTGAVPRRPAAHDALRHQVVHRHRRRVRAGRGRLRLADPVVSFFADQVPASAALSGSAPLRAMTVVTCSPCAPGTGSGCPARPGG